MIYKGYRGKYLRINLTTGDIQVRELDPSFAERFLGGNGFGTKILWDEVGPDVDPLGPDNRLIVATGPLCGTLMPNSGRLEFIAKSPLTGIYGDANAGGFFGPELKYAGYDMLIFEGRAPEPVYLCIEDGRVELRSASHLWGKRVSEAEAILEAELGRDWKFATVGPAAENGVRYACIQVSYSRSAARCGIGTVMGSKNLKAIAVRGSGDVAVADVADFKAIARDCIRRIRGNEFYPGVHRYGTPGLVVLMNPMGRFPTRNFQEGSFEYAEEICAERLRERYLVRDVSCFGCPVSCDKVYRVTEGEFAGTLIRSVEYETLGALGAGVWNRDLPAILYANRLCDELGMDTISAGRTIAFAMELWQHGILTSSDTGGLTLKWGDARLVHRLLEMIAYRRGFGDLLAEGVRRAAQAIGRGAAEYAMEVKGMEIPAQDGRAQKSMGLAHVTSTRGADHLKGFPIIDETGYPAEGLRRYGEDYMPDIVEPLSYRHKPMLVKDGEDFGAVVDSSGNCKSGGTFVFAEIYWPDMAAAIQAATGMEMPVERLKRIGERIYNLQRCYDVWHGISRADDRLPRRFTTEPSPSGNARGQIIELEPMLEEYYRLRGWDPVTGYPTAAKLRELGLDEAIARLDLL